VRVDIVDLVGLPAGALQGSQDAASRAVTLLVGLRDVERVGGGAVAGDLTVDVRAARQIKGAAPAKATP